MDKYRNEVLQFVKADEFFVSDIIEFSAIKYARNGNRIEEVESMDIFVNPGYSIPENITELTGITNEMIKDAPTTKEAALKVKEFLGDNPNLLGYNSVKFD